MEDKIPMEEDRVETGAQVVRSEGAASAAPALERSDSATITEEAADNLVRRLEASDDEDDSDEEGCDTHGGAWRSLQYASYMAGMHHFVKEKHRAQGYLAAELAKADHEMGEGQQDPTKRPTLEGDIEHYSVQKQITRRLNKKSPGFLSAVGMIWNATRAEMISRLGEPLVAAAPASGPSPPAVATQGAGGDGDGVVDQDASGIDEAAFVCLMVKVHYLIICPPVHPDVAHKNARNDWAKDNASGSPTMSYDLFVASIFELVDIWTETLEASEYDALAMMIAKGVTTEVDTPTETRPDVEDGRGSVAGSVASVTDEKKTSLER
ncbi:unnamed protein product [Ectocarpus sp. 13 AM-2016]